MPDLDATLVIMLVAFGPVLALIWLACVALAIIGVKFVIELWKNNLM
jgi:hypothetical protein